MSSLALKCITDHYDNTYFIIKTIALITLFSLIVCFFVYCIKLYTDLLFIKKLSFALSQKICTAQDAWEILSQKRGVRLCNYITSEYHTAFLIVKIMHEYSVMANDPKIADLANKMYTNLQASSTEPINADLRSSSLSDAAELALNFTTSNKNNIIKLFNITSSQGAQIFFFWLFVVVFTLFLLIQLLRLWGA